MEIEADLLIENAAQVFTAREGRGAPEVLEGATVAVRDREIAWLGPASTAREHVRVSGSTEVVDASECVVTPGFIDPHTHVVFAGSRPREFQWRLQGRPYLEILEQGGGILSTVQSVRQADESTLVAQTLPRLARMLAFGITTCEVKSGYGLDVDTELKMLRVVRTLGQRQPIRLVPTFLGAHAVPAEFAGRRDEYVDLVRGEMLDSVTRDGLASGCDVYVEKAAFSTAQAERVLERARDAGLTLHVHAGQFTDLGGPEMAARLGGSSVDHLDVISDSGLEAMAAAGSVAVLLPGACVSLAQPPPRVERFREAGVHVALATDCNPGTSYTENLPLMAFVAVTQMGMTCEEGLYAITRHAARALGLPDGAGTISRGARADLLVHDASDWREILYHFGVTHVRDVFVGGRRADLPG